MSIGYRAVLWNRQKRIYDLVVAGGVGLYLATFTGLSIWLKPGITLETMLLRALGTAALVLLHVVLSIGPLCRIDPRFLPLLYNRRHLGVTTFLLGAAHATLAVVQFHSAGNLNPAVSVLTSNPRIDSVSQFPFELLGVVALGILFLMASTSHDFWLHNLTAPTWKTLHLLVLVAYPALVLHVALGALQSERSPGPSLALGLGVLWIVVLHSVAAWREHVADRAPAVRSRLIDVGPVDGIPEGRARIVNIGGERVAVFRYDGKLSAVSNVCQHQNGPLGEGRIVDGCITCPWHGYQYLPTTGASPPPFTESVPTFTVRLEKGRVFVDPRPHPPGTEVPPAILQG